MTRIPDSASTGGEDSQPNDVKRPTAEEVEGLIRQIFAFIRQNQAAGVHHGSGEQFNVLREKIEDVDFRLGNILDTQCPPGFTFWDQPWIEAVCKAVKIPVPDPKPGYWIG